MKIALIIVSCVAVATAQYADSVDNSHYQAPSTFSGSGTGSGSSFSGSGSGSSFSGSGSGSSFSGSGTGSSFSGSGTGSGSSFSNNGGSNRNIGGQEEEYVPKVYKNVYVHVAPDEPEERQSKVIRVPGGDKHVNIIFVKTPSSSSQQQTEVILPEQDEHKNLVYVLLKKNENKSNIKITRPEPTGPSKPEVNFIRYSDQQSSAAGSGPSAGSGPAPGGAQPVRSVYGVPL